MTNELNDSVLGIDRRTVLKSVGAASAAGLIGVPAVSGGVLAEEHEVITCDLDVMCAIDASGSLTSADATALQDGVNAFIDDLPTDGTVRVGSLEFAGGEIRKLNGLQVPGALSVDVTTDPSGDTPMPAALDIADQLLYEDDGARAGAQKIIVVFTDGGPNYEAQYVDGSVLDYTANLGGDSYHAPRNGSANWSSDDSAPGYDNADGATANVSEGEMAETAHVAKSVRSGSIGGGATNIATVYVDVVGDDQNAMTGGAISTYTDLPTYLEQHIATSEDFAVTGDLEDVEDLAGDIIAAVEEACPECIDCDEAGLLAKYEFECTETEDQECVAYDFVLEEGDGSLVDYEAGSYTSKDDEAFEPVTATFETDFCTVWAVVKAGPEIEAQGLDAAGGSVTATNIGRYAISFVAFYCTEEAAAAAAESFPANGAGDRGRGNDEATEEDNQRGKGKDNERGGGKGEEKSNGKGRGKGR